MLSISILLHGLKRKLVAMCSKLWVEKYTLYTGMHRIKLKNILYIQVCAELNWKKSITQNMNYRTANRIN